MENERPIPALPRRVCIREVGPRDGFQNEAERIPTETKIRLIDALSRTGLTRLEVTSFVRSDVIPQLADAAEVLEGINPPADVALSVLIPNTRGLELALAHRRRFHEAGIFLSASETHNRRNINRSVQRSLAALEQMLPDILAAGLRCEAVIATSFGCPYEGRVDPDVVLTLARRLRDAGADEIGFGDTTGMANPLQVRDFFFRAREALPEVELTAHFHNTRGQGLANVFAAMEAGINSFEASFGELGGCPVPPGSTGNIATEDLVSMLTEMGVEHGVSLPTLLAVTEDLRSALGRALGSHLPTAGPVMWHVG